MQRKSTRKRFTRCVFRERALTWMILHRKRVNRLQSSLFSPSSCSWLVVRSFRSSCYSRSRFLTPACVPFSDSFSPSLPQFVRVIWHERSAKPARLSAVCVNGSFVLLFSSPWIASRWSDHSLPVLHVCLMCVGDSWWRQLTAPLAPFLFTSDQHHDVDHWSLLFSLGNQIMSSFPCAIAFSAFQSVFPLFHSVCCHLFTSACFAIREDQERKDRLALCVCESMTKEEKWRWMTPEVRTGADVCCCWNRGCRIEQNRTERMRDEGIIWDDETTGNEIYIPSFCVWDPKREACWSPLSLIISWYSHSVSLCVMK